MEDPFPDLTNAQLLAKIQEDTKHNASLRLQILSAENFLAEKHPQGLETAQKIMAHLPENAFENGERPASRKSSVVRRSTLAEKTSRSTSLYARRTMMNKTRTVSMMKPRLNLATKLDILENQILQMTQTIRDLKAAVNARQTSATARIDEQKLVAHELHLTLSAFEDFVMQRGVDPITGKVPAERFVKFINGWIRDGNKYVDRLRIRWALLRHAYGHQWYLAKSRKELGKGLKPVDYDELEFKQKESTAELEKVTAHFLGLRESSGKIISTLSNLQKKQDLIQRDVEHENRKIAELSAKNQRLEESIRRMATEVQKWEVKIEGLEAKISKYRAPNVLEYAGAKSQVLELEHQIKIAKRRKNLQAITGRNLKSKLIYQRKLSLNFGV
jgi:Domain of unknown function (DUF4201)